MDGSNHAITTQNPRRGSRNRKQLVTLDDYSDLDSVASDAEESFTNPVDKPSIHSRRHWDTPDLDQNTFQCAKGEGDALVRRRWDGSCYVTYWGDGVLIRAEKSLVEEQKDQHSISLERHTFTRQSKLTQVPYHADMLPHYNYFAGGIQQYDELESFKISNFHLPPSPWLKDSIIPLLEMNSNREDLDDNLTTLELVSCSLSADDMSALAAFLLKNKTLRSLNLSKNNIESVDTVNTFAKAIKKKSSQLIHVNLAHCSLGGGDKDVLEKLLVACKDCESLEIGHRDFTSESLAVVAKFLSRKMSLTSFSLVGATVDKESKKLLIKAISKNKTIEKLSLRSNNLKLPGILSNTKKITASLSRLAHLDLSYNKLSVSGAKVLAKFLSENDTLNSLTLSKNNMTTKGANHILPVLKDNTMLESLDLSKNWLNGDVADAVIDVLKNNSTLLDLDLSGNKTLRECKYINGKYQQSGEDRIVKSALIDTTSLESIASSNHTCAVKTAGANQQNTYYEERIRKINALNASEGKKIRYKVVMGLNSSWSKDLLYDPRRFDELPLELMPRLLEMIQQEIGYNGFGTDIEENKDRERVRCRSIYSGGRYCGYVQYDPSLRYLYEIIMGWPSLPLLFSRGAGGVKANGRGAGETKKKRTKPEKSKKKRRKFGDEEDSEDEAYIPKGARKRGRWQRDPETGEHEYIPPPVY